MRRRPHLLDIPRFLDFEVLEGVMEKYGVSRAGATRMVFDEDHNGTPMPRVRRRAET